MTNPEAAYNYAEAQAALGQALDTLREKIERTIGTSNNAASALGQVAIEANSFKESINEETGQTEEAASRAQTAHGSLNSPNVISPQHSELSGASGRLVSAVDALAQAEMSLVVSATFAEQRAAELGQIKGELEAGAANLSSLSEQLGAYRQTSAEIENNARPAW